MDKRITTAEREDIELLLVEYGISTPSENFTKTTPALREQLAAAIRDGQIPEWELGD